MNRRELLTGLAAMLPASAVTVDVEKPIEPKDLVVLKFTGLMTAEQMMRAHEYVEHLWPNKDARPLIMVLDQSTSLEVHRGIAKVELPER